MVIRRRGLRVDRGQFYYLVYRNEFQKRWEFSCPPYGIKLKASNFGRGETKLLRMVAEIRGRELKESKDGEGKRPRQSPKPTRRPRAKANRNGKALPKAMVQAV